MKRGTGQWQPFWAKPSPQSGRNLGGKTGLGLRRRDLAKGCEKYRVGAWAPESEGCRLRVQVIALFFFFGCTMWHVVLRSLTSNQTRAPRPGNSLNHRTTREVLQVTTPAAPQTLNSDYLRAGRRMRGSREESHFIFPTL